ncbi:MAG: hypothetical protein KF724_07425 [Phycisphaeraceae bacterium]|nr:hypothetical protein [Phycisphaeraceae bacterium]
MAARNRLTPLARARLIGAVVIWCALVVGTVVSAPLSSVGGALWTSLLREATWSQPDALPPFAEPADVDAIVLRLRLEQQMSVARALSVLRAHFEVFRERSGLMADELLSWRTRGALAWHGVEDAVTREGGRRRALVRERFERIVASERDFREAVAEAEERLVLELHADRARALARVRGHLAHSASTSGAEVMAPTELERLASRLDRALLQQADRSLLSAMSTLIGATVVTEIVAMGTSAAVVSAAGGAASGSFIPVAGTIAGFVVGLAAGVAVDWWMSDSARHVVRERIEVAIDALERALIEGDGAPSGSGLRDRFEKAAEQDALALESQLDRWLKGARR